MNNTHVENSGLESSIIRHILMVCVGNICRSPMGEAVLKQALDAKGRDDIQVSSAGLNALIGYPPSEISQRLMNNRKIDISTYRARQLTGKLISEVDLILVMEMEQKKWIEAQHPYTRGKVYRLGEWSNLEIPDPIGQSSGFFENVLMLIDKGVADWIPKLIRD
jgi:protein-tyrosine phosphatase